MLLQDPVSETPDLGAIMISFGLTFLIIVTALLLVMGGKEWFKNRAWIMIAVAFVFFMLRVIGDIPIGMSMSTSQNTAAADPDAPIDSTIIIGFLLHSIGFWGYSICISVAGYLLLKEATKLWQNPEEETSKIVKKEVA